MGKKKPEQYTREDVISLVGKSVDVVVVVDKTTEKYHARENDMFEDAFGRMDKALYAAKSAGRNRVEAG